MALERLQARAATGIPDPDCIIPGCRRQLGWVVREGYWVDIIAMALKRLQARAAAGVLDLDCIVARSWRQSGRVMGEGHWADRTAMALERLQAGAPFVRHSWHYREPGRYFPFENISYQTVLGTECECWHICLKRSVLYYPFIVHNKSARILNKIKHRRGNRSSLGNVSMDSM